MDEIQNLTAVVVGLVARNGEVLIAKKRLVEGHFLSGAWHVPGGRVETGESVTEAVVREIREEAGIDVEVVASLGVIDLAAQHTRAHWFLCAPRTHDLVAGDDAVEVMYVTPAEAIRRFPPDSGRQFPPEVKTFFGLDH
jgi:mutator protein MutT